MYKSLAVICLFYFSSCTGQPGKSSTKNLTQEVADTKYKWTELTDSAAYPKAWNFQIFSIRDTLWVMHHAGTWFSLDGKKWTKSRLTNVLQNNGFLDYVWFKNALYAIGTFKGNIEHYKMTSAIHKSTDLKNWEVVTNNSNLPHRFFIHPFVFQDKIWIIGGSDGTTSYADVWNSADGVSWVKQADNLPFGKRDESQFVLFNGKIFMLNNDVWSSADGISWTKETDKLANESIFGYAAIVYDNQIWLLGCNRNGIFKSEILVSKDGKIWETQKAPWSPRGAATACLHKGKVFLTGGKYGGQPPEPDFIYSNDVWTLEKRQ